MARDRRVKAYRMKGIQNFQALNTKVRKGWDESGPQLTLNVIHVKKENHHMIMITETVPF